MNLHCRNCRYKLYGLKLLQTELLPNGEQQHFTICPNCKSKNIFDVKVEFVKVKSPSISDSSEAIKRRKEMHDFLYEIGTCHGKQSEGFNKKQLELLGVNCPPQSGWRKKLVRQAGEGKIKPEDFDKQRLIDLGNKPDVINKKHGYDFIKAQEMDDFLASIRTERGGYTHAQINLLGYENVTNSKWRKSLIKRAGYGDVKPSDFDKNALLDARYIRPNKKKKQ